jgi:hypothetical protein
MAVMPSTPKILKIFEPTKFPKEIAFSFLIMAIIEAASLGILVPIETTVTPIIRSLTPKSAASEVAPLMSNSDPPQSPNPPIAKNSAIC